MSNYNTLKRLKTVQQDVEEYIKCRLMKKPLRPMCQWIKDNYNNSNYVGVEIGVWKGDNAVNILKNMDIKQLFLIDPYEKYYARSRGSGLTFDTVLPPEDVKQFAINNLREYGDKAVCLFDVCSDDAINIIPDGLDFVYIDGNHSYEYVKKDIVNYFAKVRLGGVIGGHDYTFSHPDVIWAVTEFIHGSDLDLFHVDGDWWIIKSKVMQQGK